jgi:hypothetical protein
MNKATSLCLADILRKGMVWKLFTLASNISIHFVVDNHEQAVIVSSGLKLGDNY